VHRALADSPGLTRVAAFGPLLGTATALPGLVLDAGTNSPAPAVEVFAVPGPAPRAALTPLDQVRPVLGGPDAVGALVERDPDDATPTVPADDPAVAAVPVVVSDALVRRERAFGRLADATSAALSADDPLRLDAPARDYLLPGQAAQESVVRYTGGTPSASSSASDVDSIGGARVEHQPHAALDGDPTTSWRPAVLLGGRSQWWQVALDAPVPATAVTVTLDPRTAAVAPSRVRVGTDAGERVVPLERTAAPQRLALPPGPTRTLRIAADPAPGTAFGPQLGLAEVALPGAVVRRTLVAPAPDRAVDTYAFDTAPGVAGCLATPTGSVRCPPALVRGPEEPAGLDRAFTVAVPADYDIAVTAVPRPGPALDALLAPPPAGPREWPRPTATASSSAVPDPRAGPGAAVDADPATTWTAAGDDPDPALTLSWGRPLGVDRLRVVLPPGTAVAAPTAVEVTAGGQERTVNLEPDGTARFAPLTADRLTLRFPVTTPLASFDPYTRGLDDLGVGVAEVEVPGLGATDPTAVVAAPCGSGPTVRVDGRPVPTAVRATVADLRALRPVPVELCGPTATGRLGAGAHTLTATGPLTGDPAFTAVSATLTRRGAAPPAARPRALPTPTWDVEHRTVEVPARSAPALLTVPENANPGWVAALDGAELAATTVDGWQQGYLLPPGPAGTVRLDFTPGPAYRAALLAGAVGVLVVLGLLLWPVRGPQPPPARPGRRRGGVVLAAVALTGVAAGVVGLAALAVLAYAGGLVGARRRRPLLGAVTAVGVLGCGLLLVAVGLLPFGAVAPDWIGEPARQVLGAVAVAAVAAALLPVPAGVRATGSSGTRSRQRVTSGRSSSR
jgi:arabinofuranan 3-O-arabinosyltransferase